MTSSEDPRNFLPLVINQKDYTNGAGAIAISVESTSSQNIIRIDLSTKQKTRFSAGCIPFECNVLIGDNTLSNE